MLGQCTFNHILLYLIEREGLLHIHLRILDVVIHRRALAGLHVLDGGGTLIGSYYGDRLLYGLVRLRHAVDLSLEVGYVTAHIEQHLIEYLAFVLE